MNTHTANRRQHYLPVSYLRSFCCNPVSVRNHLRLWAYSPRIAKRIPATSVCSARDFYTSTRRSQESLFWGPLETDWRRVVHTIEQGPGFSEAAVPGFLYILLLIYARGVSIDNRTGRERLDIVRVHAGNLLGHLAGCDFEPTSAWLHQTVRAMQGTWHVNIIRSKDPVFWTSDSPVAMIAFDDSTHGVYCPISPRSSVIVFPRTRGELTGSTHSPNDISALNSLTLRNAHQHVFSSIELPSLTAIYVRESLRLPGTMSQPWVSQETLSIGRHRFPALGFFEVKGRARRGNMR